MSKNRKRLYLGLALLALIVIGVGTKLFFFSRPKPVYVTSVAVVGDVEKTVLATGTLEPYTLVNVGAQVSGQVVSLRVVLGQTVKKGDLIAQIDPATQTNTLMTAQANLNNVQAEETSAEASLAQAQSTATRQETLYKADAGAQADTEAAATALKGAAAARTALVAQIRAAQIAVKAAQLQLSYTRINAPIDGTIVSIVTKQGQTVNANQSAPTIVMLGQLSRMTVYAQISEADIIRVKPAMDVYFTILGAPNKRYSAILRSIEPAPPTIATDSVTAIVASTTPVYYNGLFDVGNPDGLLRTSMTAQVYIVLAAARHVPIIPATALGVRSADGSYSVQVMDTRNQPQPRQIKTGVNDGTHVEVTAGLQAGEKVVVRDYAASAASGASSGTSASPTPSQTRSNMRALNGGGGRPPGM